MISVLYLHNTAEISGGERSLLALWENLDRARFRPVLAVPCEGALTEKARALDVECLIWSVPPWRPWYAADIWRSGRELRQFVAEKKVGVVHSYTPRNNVLAALVGRRAGFPVIWHERNLTYGGEWDISSLLANLPDAILCNSRAVASRFARSGRIPGRVVVIHNGVDPERFKPGDAEAARRRLGWGGKQVVGLVSNLHQRKNVEGFLRVAARLAPQYPTVSFLVVGGMFGGAGNERRLELQSRAEHGGLAGRIIFTDFQDDVRPYVEAMDVYCSVTAREACSRALLEAMSMGKPCVAVNDGGNPEIVEHGVTGLLAPPDERSFGRAVEELVKDPQLRERYGRAGRARVEGAFTVKKQTDRTQELYLRLREGGCHDIRN